MELSIPEDLQSAVARIRKQDIEVRTHPWTIAKRGGEEAYHDLRTNPHLIETVLEDFVPFGGHPAIQRFYRMLGWLNGVSSNLESNDSAFSGPEPRADDPGTLECGGRLMVFARRLNLNTDVNFTEWATLVLVTHFKEIDLGSEEGGLSLTYFPTWFTPLGDIPEDALGMELEITFRARGKNEQQAMARLGRIFEELWRSLRKLSDGATDFEEISEFAMIERT